MALKLLVRGFFSAETEEFVSFEESFKKNLYNDSYTLTEASEILHTSESILRHDLESERLGKILINKKGVWAVTKEKIVEYRFDDLKKRILSKIDDTCERKFSQTFSYELFCEKYKEQYDEPCKIEDFFHLKNGSIWLTWGPQFYTYKNNLYYFNEKDFHTEEEQKLLIKQHYFKHEKKFKRLKKEIRLFDKLEASEVQERELIPEEVRFSVWRRDEGRCVQCGSKKNLEFDHIIPISKGGSSTERNIQLLCAKCNREKSDKI